MQPNQNYFSLEITPFQSFYNVAANNIFIFLTTFNYKTLQGIQIKTLE
jgi:hypothetical protein